MLRDTFVALANGYSDDLVLIDQLWQEIEQCYSGSKRHYHNLQHLSHLLAQITEVKAQILRWDVILFSLYYHDIVYKGTKSDNEAKSAVFAVKRMGELGVPNELIENCEVQILATKSHELSGNSDTNLFTDADLAILGSNWEDYVAYYESVRKEYAVYPDFMYRPGRKKVLEHFLKMPKIYKTDYFYRKFEAEARENIAREIALLS